ncbi:MAG: hypothetical protein ACRD26_22065 [Vicinamibacterales bacterium]
MPPQLSTSEDGSGSWPRRGPRSGIVWSTAALLALATFAFRFLTLRSLPNDHFMHLAWAQQILLGEVPGRDFVEPGMPLTVALSALAQWIHFAPLSEAVLSIGLLSMATAATCVAATRLSGSLLAGTTAALFQILIQPRLYSYPKILVPSVALLAAQWYASRPSAPRATLLGLWAACAALLRHDLGVYATAALFTVVCLAGLRTSRARRHLVAFTLAMLVLLSPYAAFVSATEGFAHDMREGLEFSKGERHQLLSHHPLPEFFACVSGGDDCSWSRHDSAAYLFWLTRLLVPVSAAMLLARRRAIAPGTRDALLGAIVLMAGYGLLILRHPVAVRIADVVPPVAIVSAWVCSELFASGRSAWQPGAPALVRASFAAVAFAAFGLAACSVYMLAGVREQLVATRVLDGIQKIAEVSRGVAGRASVWPWRGFWPAGDLPPVIEYLSSCTTPTDRLLLTWSAPEYYYFSRRGFAGGHVWYLSPRGFADPQDDLRMLERLERRPVPIALINETHRGEFAVSYARVDAFLTRAFAPVGTFTARDGSAITVALRKGLHARSTYEPIGWPCGFASPKAIADNF